MNYEELLVYLNNNHLYPTKQILSTKKGDVVSGLYLEIPPILAEDRKERVDELLEGKPFETTWFPNIQQLHITKISSGKTK